MHAALVSFVLAYPVVALMRFLQHYDPQRTQLARLAPWWDTWLLLPVAVAVVLAVVGVVLTVLLCLAYNLSARLLGGVRYTEAGSDPDQVRHADTDLAS